MKIQAIGLVVCLAAVSSAEQLTVEAAYNAIPHGRTVFLAGEAKMAAAERDYLVKLFAIADKAIVAKVEAGRKRPVNEAYAPVWSALKELPENDRLKSVRESVASAIEDEQAYLRDWQAGRLTTLTDLRSEPRVQSASNKLRNAYSQLMSMYPSENAHNKQAFFDYLCALDFI
jgi:hypothetical protein